eukprot:m.433875 g.433875  ORF g.433875 m.433875 type:complete len:79 (+) comp17635_c0_seq1:3819-4055(+)
MGRIILEKVSMFETQNDLWSSDQLMQVRCVVSSLLHIWYNDGRNCEVFFSDIALLESHERDAGQLQTTLRGRAQAIER